MNHLDATPPALPLLRPTLGRDVYIARTAYVAGEVTLGDDVTIMHHVTIRGDVAPIRVGARCNVQDGAVLHTQNAVPLEIAEDVGIGHRAVVHCRRVGPRTVIGIGAIVLDGAEVGADCIVAAGAVVTPGTIIPAGKVVAGLPAKVLRDMTAADRGYAAFVVQCYLELKKRYAAGEIGEAGG